MWDKIVGIFVKIFRWLFGGRSDAGERVSDRHKDTGAEKEPALPVTNRYRKIDWERNSPQYRKRKSVLSYQEREFYRLLRRLQGRDNHILSMVRMADVVWLPKETEDRKFHNNILCKHFDYVICDKYRFGPVLVIELDDPSHKWEHRWQIDEFKDKVCGMAGLPILRAEVQSKYDQAETGRKIAQSLGKGNVEGK